jgi:hypothetical protein
MKITFISRTSLTLLSMLILLNSFAQKTEDKSEFAYPPPSEISNGPVSYSNGIISNPENENVSEKVLKHFNRKFTNAGNIKWEQAGDNFLATFSTGETTTTSLFDKKGRMIYSVSYGSEKQLPADVKNMITNTYENYTITGVAKVLQDDRKIWVAKLTGKFDYVTARVEDGEIEEVENFQKSN